MDKQNPGLALIQLWTTGPWNTHMQDTITHFMLDSHARNSREIMIGFVIAWLSFGGNFFAADKNKQDMPFFRTLKCFYAVIQSNELLNLFSSDFIRFVVTLYYFFCGI